MPYRSINCAGLRWPVVANARIVDGASGPKMPMAYSSW
jgi:hypothetical protein